MVDIVLKGIVLKAGRFFLFLILISCSKEKYEEVKIHINELKKIHSSSALTALQSTALKNQRWPLLNLVRQILRANGYIMRPNRQSNGYDEDGRKKYIRYFIIEPEKEELTEEEVKKIANVLL